VWDVRRLPSIPLQLLLPESQQPPGPCHHYRIIFTDGACANNGLPTARAGLGVVYGNHEGAQLFMPITDLLDGFSLRSNQRAELLAAMKGLEVLAEAVRYSTTEPLGKRKDEPRVWIIATDSEYVTKGLTEWLPSWRVNFN
jgi:ribonuclease HI